MYVVTTDEMRALERASDAAGHAYAAMMERAGRAVAETVATRCRPGSGRSRVLVLAGPGNNGGDGLVAAAILQEQGFACTAYLWKRDADRDPLEVRAADRGVEIMHAADDADRQRLARAVNECDMIVDALLGTGAKPPLRGTVRDILQRVAEELAALRAQQTPTLVPLGAPVGPPGDRAAPRVVAVDGPSGLDFDTGAVDDAALTADVTVTFGCPKTGHFAFPGAARVGDLLVADIGLRFGAEHGLTTEVATPESVRSLLPPRPGDAHKGTFGKALVVAGCSNYVGAPRLAAAGAYRVGAGLVTLAVAERVQPIIAAQLSEATYLLLPNELGSITESALQVLGGRISDYDALLVGPGLGTEEVTGAFVRDLVSAGQPSPRRPVGFAVRGEPSGNTELPALPPLVLDADALNLLAARDGWWERLPAETVVTPHPGEMSRLTGLPIEEISQDRLGIARRYASRWHVTVLLKGAFTVIAAPDGRATIVPFANPLLASAGSGDVLAGAVVGLLAQGLTAYDAALCGAYLHGLAGSLRRRQIGAAGLLAGDLLPLLPVALRKVRGF